jgi:hypothetical protein
MGDRDNVIGIPNFEAVSSSEGYISAEHEI